MFQPLLDLLDVITNFTRKVNDGVVLVVELVVIVILLKRLNNCVCAQNLRNRFELLLGRVVFHPVSCYLGCSNPLVCFQMMELILFVLRSVLPTDERIGRWNSRVIDSERLGNCFVSSKARFDLRHRVLTVCRYEHDFSCSSKIDNDSSFAQLVDYCSTSKKLAVNPSSKWVDGWPFSFNFFEVAGGIEVRLASSHMHKVSDSHLDRPPWSINPSWGRR